MDTKQLNESLAKIYDEERQRIVFWNDPQCEFEGVVDKLGLDDVNIVRLNEVGGLAMKLRLERDDPESRFLLYSPDEEPEFEDDVLLDIRLYSRNFRADRSSIILDELGLAQEYLRSHLALRRKFFDSKDRMARLQRLVVADDTELDLDRKMLAVVSKADQAESSSILRTLYHSMTTQDEIDLETPPPAWTLIEKCDLDESFWNLMSIAFGYDDENPSLHKLLMRLLFSDYAHHLGTDVPPALQKQLLPRNGVQNAVVCLTQWRDSSRQASSYNDLSETVASMNDIQEYFRGLEPEQLKGTFTFRSIDGQILPGLLERLEATRDHVDARSIREIVTERQNGHWVASGSVPEKRRQARHAAFEAVAVAAEFMALRNKYEDGLASDTVEDAYTLYTEELFRFDQLYRWFYQNADIALSQGFDNLKTLRDDIEASYCNWFLVQLSLAWGKFMANGLLENWKIDGVENQYNFYDRVVRPRHATARTRKSFVIISDAFRYESGDELTSRLNGEYRFQAEMRTQLSVLPSYTTLGMASLLPHQQLTYTEKGDVLADGKSTAGTDNRNKILAKVGGMAIQAEELRSLKRDEGRNLVEGHKVIYIYHNVIDNRGENATTGMDTFRATNEAIQELADLVRCVVNMLGAHHIVITADHGCLFTESTPGETQKSKLETTPAGTVKAKKRYLIGHDLPVDADVWRGDTENTARCEGGMQFWIPKGPNRFHFSGGARFIHGGAMPQEVIVPVITVRQAKSKQDREKTRTKQVSVSVLGSNIKVTTQTHRFEFIQTESVTDRIKALSAKIAIYEEDRPVSSIETLTFASTSENLDDRQQSLMLTLKDQPFDKRKRYRLVLQDANTDLELHSQDITIDRAIADDFDF